MLTELLKVALEKRRANAPRTFHPLDGWRPLVGDLDLPSLSNDFTRMYASYGSEISAKSIAEAAACMGSYRAFIELEQDDTLGGFVFALPSASLLVVFNGPEGERRVSGYVMGDWTLRDCSLVACEFTQVFEDTFLPAIPHAAEPLCD